MIQMDKNSLVTIVGNLLKTLGLIVLFVLSFPFSLLFWPLKSVVSKLSHPAPSAPHASAQPVVVASVGQLGQELAPRVISSSLESLELTPTVSPDDAIGSSGPDTSTPDHAINLGNSK